jgi:hypothetical protein
VIFLGYSKSTWLDRNVQHPHRYTDEMSNVKTFTASPGTITEAGTQMTAARMNNIEVGIENVYKGLHNYGASSIGTDAYKITFDTPYTSINSGILFRFKSDVSNTGAATFQVDSTTVCDLKKMASGGKVALSTYDIIAGGIYVVHWDGTDYILLNPTNYLSAIGSANQIVRVNSAANALECASGYVQALVSAYAGDNTSNRSIILGVTPFWVNITSINGGGFNMTGGTYNLHFNEYSTTPFTQSGSENTSVPIIETNGFKVGGSGSSQLNKSGITYYYTALYKLV